MIGWRSQIWTGGRTEHGNWYCICTHYLLMILAKHVILECCCPLLPTVGFEQSCGVLQQDFIKVFRTANFLTGLHIVKFGMQYFNNCISSDWLYIMFFYSNITNYKCQWGVFKPNYVFHIFENFFPDGKKNGRTKHAS